MHDSKLADPLTLALAAFVIAQSLLNLPNAHIIPAAATLAFMPVILICGGLVYLMAAVFDFMRGNAFGMTVNGFYGAFFSSLFLFFYLQFNGILKFGPAANEALGSFLLVWTILTIPFVVAAFRVSKVFGALFFFVFLAFLGGALANLAGLDTAYGGYAGLISAVIGLYLLTKGLLRATEVVTISDGRVQGQVSETTV